jgi:hypothetical protein|tara:strand:- start:1459 stop:2106 length:648 start_codon:yes stop_codon:yes gene_type:complete
MNYKTELYKNGLKAIENIYKASMHNPDVDLFRSFDIINSLNDNQIASKEHLTKAIVPILNNIKDLKNIAILGSWYGLLGVMLRQHLTNDVHISNIDSDSLTEKIGTLLFNNENNKFYTDDAVDHMFSQGKNKYQLIINTSCEHMEQDDVLLMRHRKNNDTVICFQSNNYFAIDGHINCSNSLEEFVDSLSLSTVLHASALRIEANDYERYTVIGS